MNSRFGNSVARSATAVLAAVALLLFVSASVGLAGQGNPGNPGVPPPNANMCGHSYGEWNAIWWQWALGMPLFDPENPHPILDGPCDLNQVEKVWFLAGNFGGTSVRTCTVPAGTRIFFPIMNIVAWATEPDETEEDVRGWVNDGLDAVVTMECTIDGVPLEDPWAYRAVSGVFGFSSPDFGDVDLAIAGGYSVLLTPLPPGTYEIHFAGANASGWWLDVTYELTVECGPR
jgi:hypothetical protein